MFNLKVLPDFITRAFINIMIPAELNGDLAIVYKEGKPLKPFVFSHGICGDKNFYFAVHHAMAAAGHLVIAINHQDESSFYTMDKNGKDMMWVRKPFYVKDYRQK